MAIYRAGYLVMSSGLAGVGMMPVENVQSISVNPQINRIQTDVFDQFKPILESRINNYISTDLQFSCVKSAQKLEEQVGLYHPSGVIVNLRNSKLVSGFGMRDFEIYIGDASEDNYIGKYIIKSGVLNGYTLNASISDPVSTSYTFECVDMSITQQNTPKSGNFNQNNTTIINEGISVTGITMSGAGIAGIELQSFVLGISIERQANLVIGNKNPISRQIRNAQATLQFNGFIESLSSSVGLDEYFKNGSFLSGDIIISLKSTCAIIPDMNIKISNPYLESFNSQMTTNSFFSIEGSFRIPLSPNEKEASFSSNMIFY